MTRPRRRRRRRGRINLSRMSFEDLGPVALFGVPVFGSLCLFLKTTGQHLPSWAQIYDSITGRGAVGIAVALTLIGVIYALRRFW